MKFHKLLFLYANDEYFRIERDYIVYSLSTFGRLNEKPFVKRITNGMRVLNTAVSLPLYKIAMMGINDRFSRPLVSLTFDDCSESQWIAFQLLRKYNMAGTFYAISSFLNTPSFMTTKQVIEMYQAGMQIGSHTMTHPNLRTLKSSDIHEELVRSQKNLQQLGLGQIEDFASPFGSCNTRVLEEVKQIYSSHRSIIDGYNTLHSLDVYHIKTMNVLSFTTIKQMQERLNEAIRSGYWVVLLFHLFNETGNVHSMSSSLFEELLIVISERGIAVVTIAEALSELLPQVKN